MNESSCKKMGRYHKRNREYKVLNTKDYMSYDSDDRSFLRTCTLYDRNQSLYET